MLGTEQTASINFESETRRLTQHFENLTPLQLRVVQPSAQQICQENGKKNFRVSSVIILGDPTLKLVYLRLDGRPGLNYRLIMAYLIPGTQYHSSRRKVIKELDEAMLDTKQRIPNIVTKESYFKH